MKIAALEKRLFAAISASIDFALKKDNTNKDGDTLSPSQSPYEDPIQLCLALSGGLDSSVLLHLLSTWLKNKDKSGSFLLEAFHVNHGISKNALKWQNFCEDICEKANVTFFSQSVQICKRAQHSLEADARNARYAALDQFAGSKKLVFLAHHQDDQVETFLLQLKRGAGLDGLSAMKAYKKRASAGVYLRPLLNFSRSELQEYARHYKLIWVEDESNADDKFDRNFLRAKVLPLLYERWPHIGATVSRSAWLCDTAASVNDEYMRLLEPQIVDDKKSLDIALYLGLSDASQDTFLRYWLKQIHGFDITYQQQQQVQELLSSSKNNSAYIQWGQKHIERFQGKLVLSSAVFSPPPSACETSLNLNGDDIVVLCEQYRLCKVSVLPTSESTKVVTILSIPKQGVKCAFGLSNRYFKFSQNRPRKTLKVWFQEWGITPLQRQHYPVFIYNDEVFAVADKIADKLEFSQQAKLEPYALIRAE